jgi:dipeptidase E
MPLYLSSYGLGADPTRLAAPTRGRRAVIVMNALDQFGATRTRDLAHETDDLASLGWDAVELDLRAFVGRSDELSQLLESVGLVWVVGGNSFVLARAMTAARLAALLRDRLQDPEFVYAGYSAGAVVAGPDLDGIQLVDDPFAAVEGVPPNAPAETLGLVPFRVVPHWRSDHPESPAIERVAAHVQSGGLEHRCLRDGEALWVDGETVIHVGA